MVLRILGCRIGGRNWLSKIGFKIEIPLPEHLLDSGGWKERRKRILEKGAEMLFARVLVAKFGAWDASFELIQRRRKGMFWFFEWMKEKDWNKAFESIWALEEFKNSRRKKAWGKKIGGNEMEIENGGEKVERFWWIVNGFLRRKLDAIWQGNAWNCDSESRSGMTQQDEKTWKKYLGREEKKKKSGAIVKKKSNCLCFLEPQKIKSQKVCIWKDSEFDFLTEKKFGVISNRAEFGFGFPLNEEWKTKTRLENSLKIDFRWASLLGRQICETVTQVSKARLGEDRNLAWTARRKAGLTKLFSKEIRLETRA